MDYTRQNSIMWSEAQSNDMTENNMREDGFQKMFGEYINR